MRAPLAAALLLPVLAVAVGPAAAAHAEEPLRLPTPAAAQQVSAALLAAVGALPDRALVSRVPGPVDDREQVEVGLSGTGTPVTVTMRQQVVLSGRGDFSVRERGPARSAAPLSDESAPVTKLGTVVWQGFTSGDPPRVLSALLTLDPALEQPRLPLAVRLSYAPDGGVQGPLGPGGRLPGAGTVHVVVTATSAQPARLPTAADAPAADVAVALDAARAVALAPPGTRLPTTASGLPATVPVPAAAERAGVQAVPLRLTGSLTVTGTTATVTGGGTTATPGGASVAGTLGQGSATFDVRVGGPGVLALDLTAVPALDPRTLVPPGGAASWAAWAATGPAAPARRAALDLLVDVAAAGARATAFSPYLGADLPGTGSTVFRLSLAPAPVVAAVRAPLAPRPGPLAAAGVAGLLLVAAAGALWRLS